MVLVAEVQIRPVVTPSDRAAVMTLRRGPGQDRYLNSMAEIVAEAEEEQRAMPRLWAVHDAGTGALVGFTMISDNIPEPIDEDLVGRYFLWKLLIDESARAAATARRPSTRSSATSSVGPAPTCCSPAAPTARGSPRPFYLRYGFTDTGRTMSGENVLALDLSRSAP